MFVETELQKKCLLKHSEHTFLDENDHLKPAHCRQKKNRLTKIMYIYTFT